MNAGGDTSSSGETAAAGSGGTPAGMPCTPGATNEAPYPNTVNNCYDWGADHEGIPNLRRTSLRAINLAVPTTPGATYALSLGFETAGTDATIELWGADGECGDVGELLWWGPTRPGEICAEFQPTEAYSHLMMVWRDLIGSGFAVHDTITLCPSGSCGGARDGEGLGIDGEALQAPIGAFNANAGIRAGVLAFEAKVGYGRMRLEGPESIELGQTVPVETGFFRMHESEPFDEAWYCPGAGSTFTWIEEERVGFDLRGVTELARCPSDGGSGSITITSDTNGDTVVESTLAELSAMDVSIQENGCFATSPVAPCAVEYAFADGRPGIRLHAFQAPEARMEGTDILHDFSDAVLIVYPLSYASPRAVCAATGTARFTADDGLVITLEGVGDSLSCPGAPADSDIFEGEIEFL